MSLSLYVHASVAIYQDWMLSPSWLGRQLSLAVRRASCEDPIPGPVTAAC